MILSVMMIVSRKKFPGTDFVQLHIGYVTDTISIFWKIAAFKNQKNKCLKWIQAAALLLTAAACCCCWAAAAALVSAASIWKSAKSMFGRFIIVRFSFTFFKFKIRKKFQVFDFWFFFCFEWVDLSDWFRVVYFILISAIWQNYTQLCAKSWFYMEKIINHLAHNNSCEF